MCAAFVYDNVCGFCGQKNPDWKYVPYCNLICENNHNDLLTSLELKEFLEDKVNHITNSVNDIENKITIMLEKIKSIEETIKIQNNTILLNE